MSPEHEEGRRIARRCLDTAKKVASMIEEACELIDDAEMHDYLSTGYIEAVAKASVLMIDAKILSLEKL